MGSGRASQCVLLTIVALATLQFGFAAVRNVATTSSVMIDDLLKLQEAFPDNVIALDNEAFTKYAAHKSRPYSLIVFFTARHLLDKQMNLRGLRTEFGYSSKAYFSEPANRGKVFFVEVDVSISQEIVRRLEVTTLPFIGHIAQNVNLEGDSKRKIPAYEAMQPTNYPKYPWTAEDMGSFVVERTNLVGGTIERPSLLKSPWFPVLVLAVLSVGAYVAYNLYYAEFMKNTIIWMVAVIAVYWFSVSGGMFNIIRGVPMQHFDRASGKVILFLQQGQGQLGAEGFIMGSLYCTIGICVALLTQVAPKVLVNNKKGQRYAAYCVLFVAAFAYLKVTEIYRWKTGHSPVWYL